MPPEIEAEVAAFVEAFHVERPFFKRERDRADPEALGPRRAGGRREDEDRAMSEDFLSRWSRRKREARVEEPRRAGGSGQRTPGASGRKTRARRGRRPSPRTPEEDIARAAVDRGPDRRDRHLRLPAQGRSRASAQRRPAAHVVARSERSATTSARRGNTPTTGTCPAACRDSASTAAARRRGEIGGAHRRRDHVRAGCRIRRTGRPRAPRPAVSRKRESTSSEQAESVDERAQQPSCDLPATGLKLPAPRGETVPAEPFTAKRQQADATAELAAARPVAREEHSNAPPRRRHGGANRCEFVQIELASGP